MINKRLLCVLIALIYILSNLPKVSAGSRILATGGVTQAEGSAGSGLVPWAVIAGYSHEHEYDINLFSTHLETRVSLQHNIDNVFSKKL